MAGPGKKRIDKAAKAERQGVRPPQGPARHDLQFLEHKSVQFSGPLPPPNVVEGYERIMPGAATRLFDAAERQAAHRHELEKQVVAGNIKQAERGQWFGLIIGLAGIAAATFLMSQGLLTQGLVVFFTDIVALAGVFVVGRVTGRKELRQKNPS